MNKIIKFLGSARLAIFLFFVLAVFSIFGTIIPQGASPEYYLQHFGSTFGSLIIKLHLDDAYHSWWYISALFLFLVNLVVCSLQRLPISLKLYKKDPFSVNPEHLPNKYTLELKKELSRVVAFISDVLGFRKKEVEGGYLFVKDKNRWGYLSVYVVHFSLILIIVGAIIGALKGFRGDMFLPEGTSSNEVVLPRHQGSKFLDFFVKLNKFKIEYYPNGMVKEYISNVTIEDNSTKLTRIIRVNHPLTYKGVSFYQASYDEIPSFDIVVKEGHEKKTVVVAPMNPAIVGNRYLLILEAYSPHHPHFIVIKLNVVDQFTGKNKEVFLISNNPKTIKLGSTPIQLDLKGMKVTYVSILQVKKDPGVILVFLGFAMMIFGLLLVYFFEPKTFWIFVKPLGGEKVKLVLGASAKRERDMLRLKVEELAERIEKEC